MKPGEAAVRLRVEVTVGGGHAHACLVVGLVGIILGILVSHSMTPGSQEQPS